MRQKYKIKFLSFLLLNILFINNIFSQTVAPTAATASSGISISVNTLLFCIALVLLIIIIALAMTLNDAIYFYKRNKAKLDSNVAKMSIFLGFLLLSQYAFSQDTTSTAVAVSDSSALDIYSYAFIAIILTEVAIILFFIKKLRFLTDANQLKNEKSIKGEERTLWENINKLQPLEEEGNIDIGHDYDGIRELDNITPPWFIIGFAATIVFAIVYLYRFEISGSIPSQEEEFAVEMKQAQVLQDSILKLEGNKFDENTVTLLGAADVADGSKLFTANCAPCHGDKGQGVVGPNLTDQYWLHGGSVKDVFKTIKYGYVDKGMKSWKDDFSPKQIAQLASFVESLKGTNPPGAKEKQGELYVEDAVAAVADSSITK